MGARELQAIVCANAPEPAVPSGARLQSGGRGRRAAGGAWASLSCLPCLHTLASFNAHPCFPAAAAGNQRPVVTAVPLRPPVVAQDAALAPLEADALRHGALLSHYTAAAADAKDGDEAAELEAAVAQAQVGHF